MPYKVIILWIKYKIDKSYIIGRLVSYSPKGFRAKYEIVRMEEVLRQPNAGVGCHVMQFFRLLLSGTETGGRGVRDLQPPTFPQPLDP